MDSQTFTDEELTAYLDGEADAALSARIDAVRDTPEVSARLDALSVPMGQLKTAGDRLLEDAPAMPVLSEANAGPAQRNTMGWIAAAAVGALAGVTFALFSQTAEKRDWVAQVASYQALYVADTLTLAPQSRSVADSVIADFAKTTGLNMAEATALEGATFARAQVLGVDDAPLLQMVFALPDGTPIALCVMPLDEGAAAPVSDTAEGLALTRWNEGGFAFVVIGGEQTATTVDLADEARARLAL